MRSRLIRSSILLAVVPFAAIVLSSLLEENRLMQTAVVLLCEVLQAIIISLCQKDAKRLIRPSIDILRRIDTQHIPAPYEPGKFKIDFKVTGIMSCLSILSPLFFMIARIRIITVESPVLNYIVPDPIFVMLAVACLAIGSFSFLAWAKIGQAMVIANEGSDDKRYLYRAFAEDVDNDKKLYLYLSQTSKYRQVLRSGKVREKVL